MTHFLLIFLWLISLLAGGAFMYLAIGSIKADDHGLGITSVMLAPTAVATVGFILFGTDITEEVSS